MAPVATPASTLTTGSLENKADEKTTRGVVMQASTRNAKFVPNLFTALRAGNRYRFRRGISLNARD